MNSHESTILNCDEARAQTLWKRLAIALLLALVLAAIV